MLKLYGFAVSNYFNMVRMTLAAKGLDYEVVKTFPSQSSEWVSMSPMGKVPCLETEHGFIAETRVILEYLDEQYPEKSVFPTGIYDKARARQLMHSLELYLELPARRLFPGALFGGRNEELTINEVKPVLEKGVRTINHLANCGPYLMGDTPMAPDYMALYVLSQSISSDAPKHWTTLCFRCTCVTNPGISSVSTISTQSVAAW